MSYLMSDLYTAFNASAEIRAKSTVFKQKASLQSMSAEEIIINGCQIRKLLQNNLNEILFTVLKLYFTEPYSVNQSMPDIKKIRPAIIELAKIRSLRCKDSIKYVDLCCLSECWNIDLFKTNLGPAKKYASGCRIELLSRRRKKIKQALEMLKIQALSYAEKIISDSDIKIAI